jgi:CHAD domain-containing protein
VASGHVEVERKYDVDRNFVLPDPADLAAAGIAAVDEPVEHALEAVYHDTPDLRLARARITLRRRTGGSDAGWHLKLPGEDGDRRELHAPLGRAVKNPPRALLDPVRGVLRGAATAPVATLRNRRVVTVLRGDDGRAVAEVADDTVTASASGPDGAADLQAWREVEVELLDGDRAVLGPVGEWLAAAGARPSDSASKLARVLSSRLPAGPEVPGPPKKGRRTAAGVVMTALRAQVEALQAADIDLRTDRPDAVHQVRVAARRLRSILAAYRSVLDREATEPIRDELSWLGGEMSQARDDEVALGHLREMVRAEPAELVLGPVAARIQQADLKALMAGRKQSMATLTADRYLRLLDTLHGLLDDPPFTPTAGDPAKPVLRAAVRTAGKRLRRRLATMHDADADALEPALHAVRIAAKRVRYATEVGTDVLGKPAKKLVKKAKRVQTVLGEVQDTTVTRAQCRQLGIAAAAAGENAFTYGRLHGLEALRAFRGEEEFAKLQPSLRPALRAVTRG